MPHRSSPAARARRSPGRPAAVLLAAALLALPGCGGSRSSAAPGTPEPAPPPKAVAPMDLAGQPVLVMPVQASSGIGGDREQLTADVLFALTERDDRTRWITPQQLRSALRRAPGYAADPGALPNDAYEHHGQRYVTDPLAGVLRRYGALVDARLVLVPRSVRWVPAAAGGGGSVRISAAMVDSRSGNVVWYGDAEGVVRPQADGTAVASAAAALAERMLTARDG